MNNWVGMGRLTGDLKTSNSGKMATGTIAVDRPFPFGTDKDGNKKTDFLVIRFIGEKVVERSLKFLNKGKKIVVRGIVCRDTWKDGDTYKEYNFVIVQDWEFAESKNAANSGCGSSGDEPTVNKDSGDDFMNIPDDDGDDDVPF